MYLLPLVYRNLGVLNAVLGLAACHLGSSSLSSEPKYVTAALQHRINAIQALGNLLLHEECYGLSHVEQEHALATVFTLLLHDVSTRAIYI